jgi:hypothetical protein
LMEQNWDGSPEAAMDNPVGGIKREWFEIRFEHRAEASRGTSEPLSVGLAADE